MKPFELQKAIMQNIWGHYPRVSFLVPKDFGNWIITDQAHKVGTYKPKENEPYKILNYRTWFEIYQSENGDLKNTFLKCPELLNYQSPENPVFELEMIGLCLIETNAATYMEVVLFEALTSVTDKHIAAFLIKVIEEYQNEIKTLKSDILLTTLAIPEYIKNHVPESVYNFVKSAARKIDQRCKKVELITRKELNELIIK